MTQRSAIACLLPLIAGLATAQDIPANLGAASSIVLRMRADNPADGVITPAAPVIASLTYDGSSPWGFNAQEFESPFDVYNIYLVEEFVLTTDATLTEFRSRAFPSTDGNPFGTTDVFAAIYSADDRGEVCASCNSGLLPEPLLRSIPDTGFYNGESCVTDFGNQCLPAGEYLIVWAAELDFTCCGQMFFYAQAGEHDNGIGEPNSGQQFSTGCPFGEHSCWPVIDYDTGVPTGVNFILLGEPGDCDMCPDPDNCGDNDADGDSDADDFFIYIDMFASNDPCADLDQDTDIDADDFFAYLDRFVNPC